MSWAAHQLRLTSPVACSASSEALGAAARVVLKWWLNGIRTRVSCPPRAFVIVERRSGLLTRRWPPELKPAHPDRAPSSRSGIEGSRDEKASSSARRRNHSVRRNSSVAATIATAEKMIRYERSAAMAPNPVFFKSKLLNAWTAYVNGSTIAIARSHAGKPCCG